MAESRFYYPITVHRGASAAVINAPFVTTIPLNFSGSGYALILSQDEGRANQGLYVWDDKRWRFAMPQLNVSVGVIDGYSIDVYYDQTTPITDFPDGVLVFRNGIQQSVAEVDTEQNVVWAVMTPVFSSGSVKTVNGVEPDNAGNVQLTADDVGAIDSDLIGAPDGVAPLGPDGKIPSSYVTIPQHYQGLYDAATNTPPLPTPSAANEGFYWIVTAEGVVGGTTYKPKDWIVSTGAGFAKIDNQGGDILSVNNALPDADGNVVVPVATPTVAGTLVVPDGSGLLVDQDGNLSIAPGIVPFTPAHMVYVASNGDPTTGDGTVANPYRTISQAVSDSEDFSLIVIYPGVYTENVILGGKNLQLQGMPTVGNYAPTIVEGFVQHTGANQSYVSDLGIEYAGSDGHLRVHSVGAPGVKFKNIVINALNTQISVVTDATGGAWAGSADFEGIYTVGGGKIQFNNGTGNVTVRGLPEDSSSTIEINGGIVEVADAWHIQQVLHTAGGALLRNIRSMGSSGDVAAIISSASGSSDFLSLLNVITWVDTTTPSFISKTGSCRYVMSNVTRNVDQDELTGTRYRLLQAADVDVRGTYNPTNYSTNDTLLYSHLEGIDQYFGTISSAVSQFGLQVFQLQNSVDDLTTEVDGKLGSISSASGTSLVNNGTIGQLKGLGNGSGITLDTATTPGQVIIGNSGVLALSSVTGTGAIPLVSNTTGVLKALVQGTGISIAETAGLLTISSTATTGVNSVNGLQDDIVIASGGAGSGISVALSGQNIQISNTGVLALSSVTGDYPLVNTTSGQLKTLDAGTGITINDVAGLLTLANSGVLSVGGQNGAITFSEGANVSILQTGKNFAFSADIGVETFNGLEGAVVLEAGANITLTPSGNTITIASSGGGDVTSVNSLVGDVVFAAGSNITLTPSGNTITIASTGGSGGVTSLNSLLGALSITAGSGITVTPSGSNIQISATGSANPVNSLNTLSGNLNLVGDTGISVTSTDANTLLISYDGGASVAVTSLNTFTGPVVIEAGTNVTVDNSVAGTITINASTGVTSVVNAADATVGSVDLVADTGSTDGTAIVKKLLPSTGVSFVETDTGIQILVSGGGGSGTVTSVAGVSPDGSGNVPLTSGDLGALAADGSVPLSGDLDASTNNINNLPDPTDPGQPVTLNWMNNLVIDPGTF